MAGNSELTASCAPLSFCWLYKTASISARINIEQLIFANAFPAYRGDDEFVFVCYSHLDSEEVYSEIGVLYDRG